MNATEIKARIVALEARRSEIVHYRQIDLERLIDEYTRSCEPLEREIDSLQRSLDHREQMIEMGAQAIDVLKKELSQLDNATKLERLLDLMKKVGVEPAKMKHIRKKLRDAKRRAHERRVLMSAWSSQVKHSKHLDTEVVAARISQLKEVLLKEDARMLQRTRWRGESGTLELEQINEELVRLRAIIPNVDEPVKDNDTYQKLQKLKRLMTDILKLSRGTK